jgi:hypothetical protein
MIRAVREVVHKDMSAENAYDLFKTLAEEGAKAYA